MFCYQSDSDMLYANVKIITFPVTYVGMENLVVIKLRESIENVFLCTMESGILKKLKDARTNSPIHRSFIITLDLENDSVIVVFKPLLMNIKEGRRFLADKTFVIDLRVMSATGSQPCCDKIAHLEIERFYFCGPYEFCKITFMPPILNVGSIEFKSEMTTTIQVKNCSKALGANIEADKFAGIVMRPDSFFLKPDAFQDVDLTIRTVTSTLPKSLKFHVNSPTGIVEEFSLTMKSSIHFPKRGIGKIQESLHNLTETNYSYTYTDKESKEKRKRLLTAMKYLRFDKPKKEIIMKSESYMKQFFGCVPIESSCKSSSLFCLQNVRTINGPSLRKVCIFPKTLDFGTVAINSTVTREVLIVNNSNYKILFTALESDNFSYTDDNVNKFNATIACQTNITFLVNYYAGSDEKEVNGILNYSINNTFYYEIPYMGAIAKPCLRIQEKPLKFGMVTSDQFVRSIPIKIINDFNVNVPYEWQVLTDGCPCRCLPEKYYVPPHTFRICSILYEAFDVKVKPCKILFKSNDFEVHLDIYVLIKKNYTKFITGNLDFKEVPLNTLVSLRTALENHTKETAFFQLCEELPGLTIVPTRGIIGPRMIIPFTISMKVSVPISIACSIVFKINNRDSILLHVTGTVYAPKLLFMPKSIYVPRIQSGMVYEETVVLQNVGKLRTHFRAIPAENLPFEIFMRNKNEIVAAENFFLEVKQSIALYIRFYDTESRSFDMQLPYVLNDVLYPDAFLKYKSIAPETNYSKIKDSKNKSNIDWDHSWCKISGILVRKKLEIIPKKIEFVTLFGIVPEPIEVSMHNISSEAIKVHIETAAIKPWFRLIIDTDKQANIKEASIDFILDPDEWVKLSASLVASGQGVYLETALLNLDDNFTVTYSNLTFYGNIKIPILQISQSVLYMQALLNEEVCKDVNLYADNVVSFEQIDYIVETLGNDVIEVIFPYGNRLDYSSQHLDVTIKLLSKKEESGFCFIRFSISTEHSVLLKICYVVSSCCLTMHCYQAIKQHNQCWPYFCKTDGGCPCVEHMDRSKEKLQNWIYTEGTRKEMNPIIPSSFHITELHNLSSKVSNTGSLLSFYRRLTGSSLKSAKLSEPDCGLYEEYLNIFLVVKIYEEIIQKLNVRGGLTGHIDAYFLLSFRSFILYYQSSWYEMNMVDKAFCEQFIENEMAYIALSTQLWMDLIIQLYKVFVLNCPPIADLFYNDGLENFFVKWYNEAIQTEENLILKLSNSKSTISHIKNLHSNLSNCIALAAVTLKYCPYTFEMFNGFTIIDDITETGDIIHCTSILIEVWQALKLHIQLEPDDLINPNFVQMILITVHLYTVLPSLSIYKTIDFNPALGKSTTRLLTVFPTSGENIVYSCFFINNNKGLYSAVKHGSPSSDNIKKKYEPIGYDVTYTGCFVEKATAILVFHGSHKLRLFDSYFVLQLQGSLSTLAPMKLIKTKQPIYRSVQFDFAITPPYPRGAVYTVHVMNTEPTIETPFGNLVKHNIYTQRLILTQSEIHISGDDKDVLNVKTLIACLSPSTKNFWIWFRGVDGEFFVKISISVKVDAPRNFFLIAIPDLPECHCEEKCDCEDVLVPLELPSLNNDMIQSFRFSVSLSATPNGFILFDELMHSHIGRKILQLILKEEDVDLEEVDHILKEEDTYHIKSDSLSFLEEKVTVKPFSNEPVPVGLILKVNNLKERRPHSFVLESSCGRDLRVCKAELEDADPKPSDQIKKQRLKKT